MPYTNFVGFLKQQLNSLGFAVNIAWNRVSPSVCSLLRRPLFTGRHMLCVFFYCWLSRAIVLRTTVDLQQTRASDAILTICRSGRQMTVWRSFYRLSDRGGISAETERLTWSKRSTITSSFSGEEQQRHPHHCHWRYASRGLTGHI